MAIISAVCMNVYARVDKAKPVSYSYANSFVIGISERCWLAVLHVPLHTDITEFISQTATAVLTALTAVNSSHSRFCITQIGRNQVLCKSSNVLMGYKSNKWLIR